MFVCAFVCVRVSVFLRVSVNSTMVGTKFKTSSLCGHWGPSIYDVHTEGGGGQAQVDACGRGEGVQLHVDVHTEN